MTVFELRKIFTALQGLLRGYVLVLRDSARLPSMGTFAEESHAQSPAFIYCAVSSVHPRFPQTYTVLHNFGSVAGDAGNPDPPGTIAQCRGGAMLTTTHTEAFRIWTGGSFQILHNLATAGPGAVSSWLRMGSSTARPERTEYSTLGRTQDLWPANNIALSVGDGLSPADSDVSSAATPAAAPVGRFRD